eukprot:9545568-Alexandrium_andersonii.AAC.1
MRGKWGQLWSKSVKQDPSLKRSYAECSGYTQQRAFRQEWVKRRYDSLREERIKRHRAELSTDTVSSPNNASLRVPASSG